MQAKDIRLEELIPYDKNPRNNYGSVEKVMASIKEFGFQCPIIVDKDNVVICGHTRLMAAKALDMETVPCLVADLSDEQARAYRLADNKTAEISVWDFDKLREELEGLEGMEVFGFEELKAAIKHDAETAEKKKVLCPRCGAEVE